VSTRGKDNNVSPGVDSLTQTERKTQERFIKPGAIVEWLKSKGQWIVQATTGIVAKIQDTYGKEVLVNCQELNLCRE
jgi:hypothetical protein